LGPHDAAERLQARRQRRHHRRHAVFLAEVEAQGWSLNPGRYVGVAPGEDVSDEDFKEQLETLNEELEALNAQARELEQTIAMNVARILES
jgi:type I restriction enzyme M protein